MAGRGSGYDDGFGYGYDGVPEYSPPSQPRRESSGGSPGNVALHSRVSSVSDDLGMPTPLDGYFVPRPNQPPQPRYSDGYTVSPPSRPVSQFEPTQSQLSNSSMGYTVSPPSRPTSQFEPLRRYSSGRYVAETPDAEEGDISHVRLAMPMTESPNEDINSFAPPPLSSSPSTRTSSTPSTRTTRTLSWNPMNPYQLVGTATPSPPTPPTPAGRSPSTKQRFKSFRGGRSMSFHQTIAEEGGEEVELLPTAGMPGTLDRNAGFDRPPLDRAESAVDLSSFMFTGPQMRDPKVLREYKDLEANGQLSGGLGSGMSTPTITVTSSALMLASPIDVTRKLTRRGTRMGRSATVKSLAQREANKSGKVIEVIEEVPEDDNDVRIDIGDGFTPDFSKSLQRAQPLKKIYYPDANWKPLTMRWPYISLLIVISIALGGSQEYLLWKSNREDGNGDAMGILRFVDPKDMPDGDFFSSKYLSTILTVLYGILWQLTDIEVKRLEAYYQLGKPNGALAAESINIDYVTLFDIFRPIVAVWYRHWAVAVSSIASIMAVFVIPVLQSFTMELDPKRPDTDGLERKIMIDQNWSRVLSISLYVVSVFGLTLLLILQNRNSGLTADVKGIAGVAAMATKSHILMDFKDLDTLPPKEIHKRLKNHRYTLRNSSLAQEDGKSPLSREEKNKYDTNPFKLDDNPHPFMMRLHSCLGLEAFMFFFAGLIPLLLFTPASIVSETLPGLTTALAIALKFVLQTLEQDMRMMEPFFVLWNRKAPPKTLTLDYAGMAFGYMPIQALLNGHFLLAALGIGSVLTEVLTVCVSSLGTVSGSSFLSDRFEPGMLGKGQETPTSFWSSLIIVFVIMLYLMIVVLLVMLYRRRPFLPRQPSTIASVLAYVHQSKMLWDFVAEGAQDGTTVEESNNKMVKRLEEQGKTYGYGWSIGRDGMTHCGVEEEPVQAYTFGKEWDHRKATINTVENYDVL